MMTMKAIDMQVSRPGSTSSKGLADGWMSQVGHVFSSADTLYQLGPGTRCVAGWSLMVGERDNSPIAF